ncbi:BA75_04836T0 [Komagataella pastoris]|uniref:BA75_04836T0 n=1 Tax=Komagataella pastoris TaxID=4922 RepID=A0A1B2JHW8_PICPA|nr:BA75_04836T0 [Komagataella pastoris]
MYEYEYELDSEDDLKKLTVDEIASKGEWVKSPLMLNEGLYFKHNEHNSLDVNKLHDSIYEYLAVEKPPLNETTKKQLKLLFDTLITMCDDYTKPFDTGIDNRQILSVDLVSNIVLALVFPTYRSSEIDFPAFSMAFNVCRIAESILAKLHCSDESSLEFIPRDEGPPVKTDCSLKWLPDPLLTSNDQEPQDYYQLKLLYSLLVICLVLIDKLSRLEDSPDPFTCFYFNVWNLQRTVLAFGSPVPLESRESQYAEYPEVFADILKWSSTVRATAAAILNKSRYATIHDFQHESLTNFLNPYGRGILTGALNINFPEYFSILLKLGLTEEDAKHYMNKLELADSLDDLVRHIFQPREPVQNESDQESRISRSEIGEVDDDEDVEIMELHPDCNCDFGLDSTEYENEMIDVDDMDSEPRKEITVTNNKESLDHQKGETSPPSEDMPIENSDEDWRDIVRGRNMLFSSRFRKLLQDPSKFCSSWYEFVDIIKRLTNERDVTETEKQKLVDTVAKSVKDELDTQSELFCLPYEQRQAIEESKSDEKKASEITPDKVYEFISEPQLWKKLFDIDSETLLAIVDELFMAPGYRRVLIWFLSQRQLELQLVEYFHLLLTSRRGNWDPEEEKDINLETFNFSREGPLELSDFERNMLLRLFIDKLTVTFDDDQRTDENQPTAEHSAQRTRSSDQTEANNNSDSYLSIKAKENLMTLTCLVFLSLHKSNIIRINDPEYKLSIQMLVLPWIGFNEEAREVYVLSNRPYLPTVESYSETETSAVTNDREVTKNTEVASLTAEYISKTHALLDQTALQIPGEVISHLDNKDYEKFENSLTKYVREQTDINFEEIIKVFYDPSLPNLVDAFHLRIVEDVVKRYYHTLQVPSFKAVELYRLYHTITDISTSSVISDEEIPFIRKLKEQIEKQKNLGKPTPPADTLDRSSFVIHCIRCYFILRQLIQTKLSNDLLFPYVAELIINISKQTGPEVYKFFEQDYEDVTKYKKDVKSSMQRFIVLAKTYLEYQEAMKLSLLLSGSFLLLDFVKYSSFEEFVENGPIDRLEANSEEGSTKESQGSTSV